MLPANAILEAMQFDLLFEKDPINGTDDPRYTVTYQFAGTMRPADLATDTLYSGWTAFTAAEKNAIRAAMDHIETVLNVTFTEVSGQADPMLNIGNVDLPGPTIGHGGYYATFPAFGTAIATYDSFVVYDNGLALEDHMPLLLHELGHAMGLKHPFSAPTLPAEYESNKFSIMSYDVNPDTGVDSDIWALFDMFAAQDIWGAAPYNSGNTAYTGPRNHTVDTIWDTGGHDTLDASRYTTNVRLNLNQGEFSRFGTYDDAVIAFGTDIEDATGGSARDRLIGNGADNTLIGNAGFDTLLGATGADRLKGNQGKDKLFGNAGADTLYGGQYKDVLSGGKGRDTIFGGGGNDTIRGGKGADRLFGGKGSDEFIFTAGNYKDVIRDFEDNTDALYVFGHGSKADVLGAAYEQNGNVIFDFGDEDIINIKDMTLTAIADDLFV